MGLLLLSPSIFCCEALQALISMTVNGKLSYFFFLIEMFCLLDIFQNKTITAVISLPEVWWAKSIWEGWNSVSFAFLLYETISLVFWFVLITFQTILASRLFVHTVNCHYFSVLLFPCVSKVFQIVVKEDVFFIQSLFVPLIFFVSFFCFSNSFEMKLIFERLYLFVNILLILFINILSTDSKFLVYLLIVSFNLFSNIIYIFMKWCYSLP